jgi:hypothetical protein
MPDSFQRISSELPETHELDAFAQTLHLSRPERTKAEEAILSNAPEKDRDRA